MLGGLEETLREGGLEGELARVRDVFAKEFDAVAEDFEATTGKAALLSRFTRQNLDALADDRLRYAGKVIETYVGDVRGVVMDRVLSGQPLTPSGILDDAGTRVYAQVRTELRTTAMAYNRITHLEKAKKAGVTRFLYLGPNDGVTRPFCQARVGRIFTQQEIDGWDNEQGLPASIYLGGYNCRHQLRPVSDELYEELTSGAD